MVAQPGVRDGDDGATPDGRCSQSRVGEHHADRGASARTGPAVFAGSRTGTEPVRGPQPIGGAEPVGGPEPIRGAADRRCGRHEVIEGQRGCGCGVAAGHGRQHRPRVDRHTNLVIHGEESHAVDPMPLQHCHRLRVQGTLTLRRRGGDALGADPEILGDLVERLHRVIEGPARGGAHEESFADIDGGRRGAAVAATHPRHRVEDPRAVALGHLGRQLRGRRDRGRRRQRRRRWGLGGGLDGAHGQVLTGDAWPHLRA